jgi:mannosyl-oligosaccharide alpha-1,3-glucosidase
MAPSELLSARASAAVAFALVVTSVALFVSPASAAEWSKMKTCSDIGFCRRHRARRLAPIYSVAADTVDLVPWDGGATALVGTIVGPSRVKFAVTAMPSGVYRLVIDDADKPLHRRHVVKDVIVESAKPLSLSADHHLAVTADRVELASGGFAANGPKVVITYTPFKMEIVTGGESPITLISFNDKTLFRFETHRTKPVPSPSPSPSQSPSSTSSSVVTVAGTNVKDSGDLATSSDMKSLRSNVVDGDDVHGLENEAMLVGEGDAGNVDSTPSELISEAIVDVEADGLWEETFGSHTDPKLRGPESIGSDIAFPFAEHLYGIPERTERVSLPHTVKADGAAHSEPYRMYNLDVFEFELHKTLGLYGTVPLLVGRNSGQSAAVLWLNTAETYLDVFEDNSFDGRVSHWYSETGRIDVFFMPGPSISEVFRQYRMLTGPPAMPQRFSLGYHQCRWNYRDETDVRSVDAEFDNHNIPYDVLWLDIEHTRGKRYFTWDMDKFPDPSRMQKDLAARGRKMVTIIDPHVKRDKKYEVHRVAEVNNYYVQTPEGKPFEGWCWPGSSSYYDFTSPVARAAWASRFNPTDYPHFTETLYTWVDMNEPSVFNGPEMTMPKHMIHADGVEHRDIHNQYGFYVQQATHEGQLQGRGGKDRPFVLSRSFFAGSQRFGSIWTGDNTASWDHLETTARMLLPLQITGMVFSGADVGGFFGNPSTELLVRWYQAGAFQPFFRGHAHLDTNRREPWLFGEQNTALIATAIRERYAYLPLWYTLMAGNALEYDSGPPMRPMWWEFPQDKQLDDMEDQWMVGSALLVAPVLKEGASTRVVYLPGSEPWYDLYDNTNNGAKVQMAGIARELVVTTPIDRMLVFQRGGCIVPRQERRRRSSKAMDRDPYTLVVALDNNGAAVGELYMDDGKSYEYATGAHVLRKFTFANGTLSAATLWGSGSGYDGEDAAVERIVVLGYTGSSPRYANVSTKLARADVILTRGGNGPAALVVRSPGVLAGKGEWRVTLVE